MAVYSCSFASSAVTYYEMGGRFGDHLIEYLHAKWFSYSLGLPLLYKPFKYSKEFKLDDLEEPWTKEKEKSFLHVKELKSADSIQDSTLYLIPFFSESPDDYRFGTIPFAINWRDPTFQSILRTAFTPKKQRPNHPFPPLENLLTVALHVRRGGGADPKNAHEKWPLRFAPDSYYIESLRIISDLFPSRPIYVYIFTDDLDPGRVADKYAEALLDLPIQFNCRREGNHHSLNIIEDFLAMMEFDCLIRSTSNYSFLPAMIGQYRVVISPKHFTWRLGEDGMTKENYIDQKEILMPLF
ncbi:MAG TPA: hypothetical protein VLG76_00315 [Rhabdochlamydiaceae bacterium]|nr:hypothetical protein [Rhabdochlamydiaceae bacterium]